MHPSFSDALFKITELIVLFAACSIGPGFLLVRRTSWTAAEKIGASFGLSVLAMGAAAFAVYLGKLPVTSYGALTVLGAVCFAAGWADIRQLWRDPEARQVIYAYALVAVWVLGWLALIRSYGGGGWGRDWIEQYERVEFFKKHKPLDTDLSGLLLPARPPLMNLFCVPFFEMVGGGFPQFQTICALLSAGAVFPAYLFARQFSSSKKVPLVALVAVFAFNPMFIQNSTYTWTKMQAAALVALGVYFYWRGVKDADAPRLRMSVVLLAAGVLIHYSAAPYALFVALHFALFGRRSFATRPMELAIAAGIAVAVIGPWIAWSISAYGVGTTFTENTTAGGFRNQTLGQNTSMVFRDVIITIIPGFLRGADVSPWAEAGSWGHIRELAFLTYQANALLMFGIGGAIALGYVVQQDRKRWDPSLVIFGGFIVAGGLVGVAAHPWPDNYGLAHIALQTLCIIGLGIVAGAWSSMPVGLRQIALGGFLVDLVFGVALHVIYESRTFGAGSAGEGGLISGGERPLPDTPWQNWVQKGQHHFLFLGDTFGNFQPVFVVALLFGLWRLIRGLIEMGGSLEPTPVVAPPDVAGAHLEPAPASVLTLSQASTPEIAPTPELQTAPAMEVKAAPVGVELEAVQEAQIEPLPESQGVPAPSKRVLNGQA